MSGWIITVAACLTAFALALSVHREEVSTGGLAVGAVFAAGLGSLAVIHRPAIRSGWLLLLLGLFSAVGAAGWMFAWRVTSADNPAPLAGRVAIGLSEPLWAIAYALLLILVLGTPDGAFLSRRWRIAAAAAGAMAVLWTAGSVVAAAKVDDVRAYVSATGLLDSGVDEPAMVMILWIAAMAVLAALVPACVAALVLRYRRSDGEQRQQVKWVVSGCALALAAQFGEVTEVKAQPWASLQDLLTMTSYLALAAGFGFALFRYRLWDIDLVIRRSLVFATLWLLIAGAYLGLALSLGVAISGRVPVWLAIALTALATIAFQPARRRLEMAADRWVFGRRRQPFQVVHDFGEQLGATEHPGDIAAQLAASTSSAMRLAWARVTIPGFTSAEVGDYRDGGHDVRLPLTHGGVIMGELRCQPSPGLVLSDDERATLAALCSQAGTAVSHALLARRIVKAQETERRRLERNIHDGAQQELVALVARLGLARQQNGQADHGRLLAELQGDLRSILSHLRDLAQGVYPSVLADGGLAAAVEDRCSRLPIQASLRIAPELRGRRFDENVEGAAYFVVAEGLTNLLRHSGAAAVDVSLALYGEWLVIRVADNGAGFEPSSVRRGGGLEGLSDRLQAIGGSLSISSEPSGGTRLEASLPIRRAVPL